MTPAEAPLRLIPKRKPPALAAIAVMVASLLVALALRLAVFGLNISQGLTTTVFPALMVTTLYGGLRYGLAAVALVGAFVAWMIHRTTGGVLSTEQILSLVMFFGSALITVGLSGGLREVVVRQDETRRARDEAEAHRDESEGRFRILADSAAALMWVTRPDRTREFVNRAYCEFLAMPPAEAVAFNWRDRIHQDDVEHILAQSIAGESSLEPFVLEGRYLRHDGQWRWLRTISRPRRSPSGELEGFIGIGFDVTDAKQVEADLKRINDLLAEKVDAALAERDAVQAALMQSQKLEALGQLTGGVAHDFNNLLTVIIGALDIILHHSSDEARRRRLGEAALGAARRGERLTQQLLAFSRRQPLKPEVLSIDALLRDSETLLRRAVGDNFDLVFDLDAQAGLARIDGVQFEAAVLNLLINARDATGDGGRIVISTGLTTLGVAHGEAMPGPYYRVTVSDDGEGMETAVIARALEPFFTTKPVGKGTGLGLSQVYGFARQSGGTVEIDSAPGQGARITLLLPVSAEAATVEATAPAPEPQTALAVLLVEDDPDVGDLVEAMLRELGHTVIRAANVEQALRATEAEQNLGLMLSDIIMPGGRTGFDLAREVAKSHPRLPIILSSGYTGPALEEADKAPWPLLRKPYTLDGLKSAIAAAMDPAKGPAGHSA